MIEEIYCPECGTYVESVIADEIVELECPVCQFVFEFIPTETTETTDGEDLY